MIIRRLEEIIDTEREVFAENRNWVSRRLLLADEGMGFSLHDTTIFAGTTTFIHYKHHLEGVYCIEGAGEVELIDTGECFSIEAGAMYALDKHDKHYLRAIGGDMRIICVFNPALSGREVHREDGSYAPPSDA